jgi:hypothetical protein
VNCPIWCCIANFPISLLPPLALALPCRRPRSTLYPHRTHPSTAGLPQPHCHRTRSPSRRPLLLALPPSLLPCCRQACGAGVCVCQRRPAVRPPAQRHRRRGGGAFARGEGRTEGGRCSLTGWQQQAVTAGWTRQNVMCRRRRRNLGVAAAGPAPIACFDGPPCLAVLLLSLFLFCARSLRPSRLRPSRT